MNRLETRNLLRLDDGVVFGWNAQLAARSNFMECDVEGNIMSATTPPKRKNTEFECTEEYIETLTTKEECMGCAGACFGETLDGRLTVNNMKQQLLNWLNAGD